MNRKWHVGCSALLNFKVSTRKGHSNLGLLTSRHFIWVLQGRVDMCAWHLFWEFAGNKITTDTSNLRVSLFTMRSWSTDFRYLQVRDLLGICPWWKSHSLKYCKLEGGSLFLPQFAFLCPFNCCCISLHILCLEEQSSSGLLKMVFPLMLDTCSWNLLPEGTSCACEELQGDKDLYTSLFPDPNLLLQASISSQELKRANFLL